MKDIMADIVAKQSGFVEMRYHKRLSNTFMAQNHRVDVANHNLTEGVGVRALVDGHWGFAATADTSKQALNRAIEEAQSNARVLAKAGSGKHKVKLARSNLSQKDYVGDGFHELQDMPIDDKLGQVVRYEKELAESSSKIQSAICRYNEIIEEKIIVTSDGAKCSLKLAQPEFRLTAVAEKDGEQIINGKSTGVSGGWNCLFSHPSLNNLVQDTSQMAIDLISAKYPQGGKKTCILAPAVVGLLCHEAVGHTVEADFVKAGSVAQGKIGQRVASDLVSMADTGTGQFGTYATGTIPFDDEGVETENTMIIENGILKSYLHNRESAEEFGVSPTGNARAWLYKDEPLIRMRNTYLLPGKSTLEEMIASIDDGYLIEGAGSGQADANGEFMFGCGHVWHIVNGKKVELLRKATLAGIAFDVLKTVDMVSQEFLWDLGSGYCGKGQPAKVDAGGPYIRCNINIGGRQ